MHRRQILQAAVAGAVSAFADLPSALAQMRGMPGAAMAGMMGRLPRSGLIWPTGLPLQRPDILANTSPAAGKFSGTLVASPYPASMVYGRTTELWGYNNAIAGPLIELREGQQVTIDFANRLGLDSTIHWHGLAVPADQDGSPMDPVQSGTKRSYSFDVPMGSAGTYWYHPHAHQTTTLQVAHGLAAPLIVRSADDPLAGLTDLTLMITSLALDQNGQVAAGVAPMGAMSAMMMAGTGDLLVNGQKLPVHATTPGATERWRIINATADRYVRLSLDGHRFTIVGSDGGLLEQPLPGFTDWVLAPAQRIEIVVTIASQQSARYSLRDLGYGGGMAAGTGAELMTIATSNAPALPPVALPGKLRRFDDPGPATARQQVVLSTAGMGMMGPFLINGRTFDMDRVDLETAVDRVELWDLVNATFMDHPIHIHGTQFQLVVPTMSGSAAPFAYPAWFDTMNVPAGQTITIKVRQKLPGKRMFHCHLLAHEDAGMMAVLDVRPA